MQLAHRRYRRVVRLHTLDDEIPHWHQISNPWQKGKNGRQRLRPDDFWYLQLMRT